MVIVTFARPLVAVAATSLLLWTLAAGPARAEEEEERGVTYSLGANLHITLSLDAALAAFSATNTNFGIGTTSLTPDGARKGTRRWGEGFVKPQLGLLYNIGDEEGGFLYSKLSAIGATTQGDGDALNPSATANRPSKLAVEDAAFGWQSGFMFEALGDNAFDLSYGRQSFTVGDSFLIADGTQDGVRRAATYLGPRTAFDQAGILRINTSPVRADLFHLRSAVDQGLMLQQDNADTKLWGGNIEWFESSEKDRGRLQYEARKRYVGATFVNAYSADSSGGRDFSFADGGNGSHMSANRDGLRIYALRFGGTVVPTIEDFALYGEYGIQRNDRTNRRVRANAWYIQPQYTLSTLPWSPRISYRYAHFSGDGNPNDTTDKSWDQFFTATGARGIGTWSQGEIYSQWTGLGNSNLNAHQIHLRTAPIEDTLNIGVVLYRFDYDKPGQTPGVTRKGIMDEIDIYAEWSTPITGLSIVPTIGAGIPRSGLRQALGNSDANDRTFWLVEVVAAFKF
ncbi:MAG: alginate export family protein [Proteobacteria bacterium]|nr:alginate export family protein [Pseudomonadota bacterium]